MKSSPVLSILLIVVLAGASVSIGEERGKNDQQPGRQFAASPLKAHVPTLNNSTSSQFSAPNESIILTQANVVADTKRESHDQALESILRRDDIVAAKAFVGALADSKNLAQETIRSMNNRIWHAKADRMAEYSEQLRTAIVRSDFDAVGEYSERMRRLTASEPLGDPAPTGDVGNRETKPIDDTVPNSLDGPLAAELVAREASSPSSKGGDEGIAEQMRDSLEERRLFPPTGDGAFNLAVARLSATPDEAEARRILGEVIEEQQAQILDRLGQGRPDVALGLAIQLRDSLGDPDTEAAWLSDYRSRVLGWADEIQQDIVTGLVVSTERAIDGRRLTIAPEGEMSAVRYVDLVASQLGQDHDEVARLATEIIESYQDLVDDRLAKKRYHDALRLYARMEPISERFGVPIDQLAAKRNDIQTTLSTEAQHYQLLTQAIHWRDKGQLIEPAGANAFESTTKAIRLAANPLAANKLLDELITEERGRIDPLIEARRLREAAGALNRLGVAIEQIGGRQAAKASMYFAEAKQITHQADLEDKRHQRAFKEAPKKKPISPKDVSENRKSPFTFVSPF